MTLISLSPAGIHLVADEAVVLEARVGHSAHNQSQAVVYTSWAWTYTKMITMKTYSTLMDT